MASITTPERNWSGIYTYSAQQIYRPQAIDELQRLIATAPSSPHALGTRHSFNDVADAARLISLEALQPAFATAYLRSPARWPRRPTAPAMPISRWPPR